MPLRLRNVIEERVGKDYWDKLWSGRGLPEAVDPRRCGLKYYRDRQFDVFFSGIFHRTETHRKKLLEIGCARSAWLPYFAKEFAFSVCGLDYSAIGCHQARQVLCQAGVEGEVVCGDFFSPPPTMVGAFDVVVSFGVAEHFRSTTACLEAFARFLRPGGLMITIIPNMRGMVGIIQKILSREIYDIHVPLDSASLRKAHELSGLEVLDCHYSLFADFCVCHSGFPVRSVRWRIKSITLRLLVRVSATIWFIEEKAGRAWKPNKITSPYITCLARKPS